MPDRFRNASLSATQRRMQEAELDVDVDPADLMEAFDKCKKGPDGAVEAKALCNELTAEAGAPVFARKVESLKKQRFTRSEFERLVAAYELKMKAAEKEGRQPQPKLGSTLSMSRTMGAGSKATLDATAAKKQADDEDADGEGGGGVADDKEPAAPKTEEEEGTSGRGRIAARIQAHQQERMKRQLGSTRDLGASTTPEAAGKEAKGAKEVEGEKKKGDEAAVPRSKSRTRWGRADSGDEDALAPPPQQQPGTSPGTGLMGVFGGLFGRKGSKGGSAPGSAQPSPAPTPEKSRPPPRATDPSPGRAAEAGESPGPSSGDAGGRTRRLSLKGLTRSLSFGQGPPPPLSPNPVADKAKQLQAEPLGATEDSLAATTMASDSRLGGTISSSASTATSPQRPTTAPASSTAQQQQKRAGGLWSRLSSPQKAAAAFREDKLQKAATTWSRRNGTMQLDASAAPFNLSDSDEEEEDEEPPKTKPQQAGGKKPAVATTPTGAASPALPPPIDTNNQAGVRSAATTPGAATPTLPPPIDTSNQGPALEFKSPMDPALSSAVQGMNHVAGMERPQLQQLLHAAQKRSISSLGNQRRNKVLMEGKMEQWSKSMGMSTWVKLHLVLYAGTKEIRLYQDCVQASWGTVPLHEKGAIALRLLEKIECPTDAKWQGRRFDLVCKSLSTDAKYPGLSIAEGNEEKVTRTARYAFRAATAQSRLLWVTLIQAILDSPAPDKPPRRSPAVMNKNASASLSTTTISSSASNAALKKLEGGSTNNVVENSASNKAH